MAKEKLAARLPRITVYVRQSCSHCARVTQWFKRRGVAVDLRDIVLSPPPAEILRKLIAKYGPAGAANPRCASYRAWGFHAEKMTPGEALRCLQSDPNLIRRPVIVAGEIILAGYNPPELEKLLEKLHPADARFP